MTVAYMYYYVYVCNNQPLECVNKSKIQKPSAKQDVAVFFMSVCTVLLIPYVTTKPFVAITILFKFKHFNVYKLNTKYIVQSIVHPFFMPGPQSLESACR